MRDLGTVVDLSPLRITGIYVGVGVLWILITDYLAATAAETQATLTTLQTIKGQGWIVASGILIFGLSYCQKRQLQDVRTRYEVTSEQLQVIHRLLQHNLRNSLNVVLGYIELCREEIDQPDCQQWLESAEAAATDFIEMGHKLGTVDNVEPTEAIDETTDLVRVIEGEVSPRTDEYPSLSIDTDLPEQAIIQGGRSIGYIVGEAIENAIIHSDKPLSERRIEIAVDRTNEHVALQITDNGPGIPDDELEAIRSGVETHLTHATGVGLWVMTWLTKLVGGEIEFDTGSTRGTTITIRFVPVSTIERFVPENTTPLAAASSG